MSDNVYHFVLLNRGRGWGKSMATLTVVYESRTPATSKIEILVI